MGRIEKMGDSGIYFSDYNILYNPDHVNVSFKKIKEKEQGRRLKWEYKQNTEWYFKQITTILKGKN